MSARPNATWSFDLDGVAVEVTTKRVKYLRLRVVPPHGEVRVSAPPSVPPSEVRRFVHARHDWVLRARADVRARAEPQPGPASSGVASLWGRELDLTVVVADKEGAELTADGGIRLSVADPARLETVLEALYRREAEKRIAPLRLAWEDRIGRSARSLRWRRMKTRWGSCNPARASITLNLALAELAPEYLEYVLVHELVHLWERGHGPAFQARMTAALPGWRELRRALRRHPPRQL